MKLFLCFCFVLVFLFNVGVVLSNESNSECIQGELILKLKDGSDYKNLNYLNEKYKVKMRSDFKIFKSLRVIRFSPAIDMDEIIAAYNRDSNVEYAEPNFIYRANVNFQDMRSYKGYVPDDPEFGKLWGLFNTGQTGGVDNADIDATDAWDIITGSHDVIVSVIDTGIDYNHEDIRDNMWKNPGETGTDDSGNSKENNGIDDDGNGFIDDVYGWDFANDDNDPFDDNSHGTHCAGTIGASGNNGIGVAGVTWDVQLMAIKFLTGGGSGTLENAIKGVEYAILNGVNIASNSWGGGGYSSALEEAILHAHEHNILFVAAAGNSSFNNDSSPHYPSSYDIDNVLAVAATNASDELSYFSCYGKRSVDIAAPGSSIFSTVPDNGYSAKSGTSMATPHVAGASALLLGYEPGFTAVDIKNRLISTSRKLYSLKNKVVSNGRLNIYNALTNTETPPPWPVIDPSEWDSFDYGLSTPHPYTNQMDQTWTIEHDGAEFMRLHFVKYELEPRYDFVYIYDGEGNLVDTVNGMEEDYYTEPVNGGVIIVTFKTDESVTKYGFDIDKYEAVLP